MSASRQADLINNKQLFMLKLLTSFFWDVFSLNITLDVSFNLGKLQGTVAPHKQEKNLPMLLSSPVKCGHCLTVNLMIKAQ